MRFPISFLTLALWFILAAVSLRAQIVFPDFSVGTGLRLVGNAARTGGSIRLTESRRNLAGALWYTTPQPVRDGFITRFQFLLLNPGGSSDGVANGGDGFAFVIQNAADSAVGTLGGSIGYDGIANSVAIEFDTWDDGFQQNGDPSGNHISVHTRGLLPNRSDHGFSLAATSTIAQLGDGDTHTVVIEYRGNVLSIFLDDCSRPVLETAIDLAARLNLDNGRAWLGFTAATASAWEEHHILSWRSASLGILQGDSVRFCSGDTIDLSVATATGTILWSTGETTPGIRVWEPKVYQATVTENLGCRPMVYTKSITVLADTLAVPAIDSSGPLAICGGDSVTLSVDPIHDSYLWSNGATTPSITIGGAGSYTVTVRSGACVATSAAAVVTMLPKPEARITANGPVRFCVGDSVTLDAGPDFARYRWSSGDTTQSIRTGSAGIYTVTVTNANDCADTSEPLQVTVFPLPSPKILPDGVIEMCTGDSLTLKVTERYRSILWSTGARDDSIIVRDPGDYYVTVTDSNGCTVRSENVTIVLNPLPVPEITTSGPVSFCFGGSVTLSAPPGQPVYRWSTGAISRSITVSDAGFYTVWIIDTNGCSGTSLPLEVIVGDSLRPTIVADGPTTICDGDSVILSAPVGYATYRWSTGDTTSSIRVTTAGSYSVTVTEASGCRGSSQPIVVTVIPAPPVPTITESGGILSTGTATSHQWYFNGELIPGATGMSHAPDAEGNYTVVVTGSNGCPSISAPYLFFSASATVSLPEIVAAPGERISVPIMLAASSGLDRPIFRRFRITLRFRASMLIPVSDGWSGTMQGNERVMTIEREWDGSLAKGTLGVLEFIVALGDTVATPLRIEAFEWVDGRARTTMMDGVVRLKDLCEIGGTRLVDATGGAALKPVRPDPITGIAAIEYDVIETGPVRLQLIDLLGRPVATLVDAEMTPGGYTAMLDARDLPAGVYICVLTTATEQVSRRVRVSSSR